MNSEFKLVYTYEMLRSALNRYFARLIGPLFPILYFLVSSFTLYRIAAGDRSWKVGALAATIIAVTFIMSFLYVSSLKRVKQNFLSLKSGVCVLGVSDSGLTFSSPLGKTEIPWHRFVSATRYNGYVFLNMGFAGYTSVPLASISEEATTFMINKIQTSNGGVA